jgi:hypothetical protein
MRICYHLRMDPSPLIHQFIASHDDGTRTNGLPLSVIRAVAEIPWGEARTVDEVLGTKHVGTCQGKHLVLQACFDQLQIPYRTVVGTFRWKEQGIAFPPHLQAFLDQLDWVHGHNWVQIQSSNGQWIDLDVTWDSPLARRGFLPLPSDWDGSTNFLSIHHPIDRWEGITMEEKKAALIASLSPIERTHREDFLRALFPWIATIRSA